MRKRVFWTVGVALGGFLIGGEGVGWPGAAIGATYGAAVGLGFGLIFSQRTPSRFLAVYWACTLGLVGIFFGSLIGAGLQPDDSMLNEAIGGLAGAATGALLGFLIGTNQLRRTRRGRESSSRHSSLDSRDSTRC